MIDFASVKSFIIPEGEVQSISKDGVVVWAKPNEIQNPYARELNYIESTGTQYIDTLWNPASPNARIKCVLTPTASLNGLAVFGSENENYDCKWLFALGAMNYNYSRFYPHLGQWKNDGVYVTVVTNRRTTIDWSLVYGGQMKCTIKNPTANNLGVKTFTTDITTHKDHLKIFQNLDTQRASMKLYYFQIYEDEVLVRDFIPVMDNNNVPCLYEKLEGKLYYNQGEGEFLYGELEA